MSDEISKTEKDLDIKVVKDSIYQKKLNIPIPQKTDKPDGTKGKTTSSVVNNGQILEHRIKRLLFYMGYYPKVGVKLRTSLDTYLSEEITDLDVYGIYIHKDFRRRTIWADCKSGSAKPLERISWIKGVLSQFPVDDVLFVKTNVKSSVKHFARKSGVQVLDVKIIERLESDFSVPTSSWQGSWNYQEMAQKLDRFARLNIPINDRFKKIGKLISTDFWVLDPYTALKKTVTALKELGTLKLSITSEEIGLIKWAIYELTCLFTLSVLKICKELYFFNGYERKVAITDGLLSGEISARKRDEIVSASVKLAFELVRNQYPDFVPPSESDFRVKLPNYSLELEDLIARITHNPLDYFDILRAMDFIFMEYDFYSKQYDPVALSILLPNLEGNMKGLRTIIHFICQITGVSQSYFQMLQK